MGFFLSENVSKIGKQAQFTARAEQAHFYTHASRICHWFFVAFSSLLLLNCQGLYHNFDSTLRKVHSIRSRLHLYKASVLSLYVLSVDCNASNQRAAIYADWFFWRALQMPNLHPYANVYYMLNHVSIYLCTESGKCSESSHILTSVFHWNFFFLTSFHGEHWSHDSPAGTCPYKVHFSVLHMNPCNLTDGWLS